MVLLIPGGAAWMLGPSAVLKPCTKISENSQEEEEISERNRKVVTEKVALCRRDPS